MMRAWPRLATLPHRYPLLGQWELTCRCNLRCLMCYTDCFNSPEQVRRELSLTEILRIMGEIREAGCLELCLTGGEPLARTDFLDIYTHAKEKGFLVTVFTNGTLLTPEIADYWAQYPPWMIEIGFNGICEASFDRITRAPGSYVRCMAAIGMILERKLPLTLKTTGLTANRDEILRIKSWVGELARAHKTRIGYKFGSEIRAALDGCEGPCRHQLPQEEVAAIEQADADFRVERERQSEALRCHPADLCGGGGLRKFHIDAYGGLQLCSGNRRQSFDLRQGSFAEGFYQHFPDFPCPWRAVGV